MLQISNALRKRSLGAICSYPDSRQLFTKPTAPLSTDATSSEPTEPIVLNFADSRAAYAAKNTRELLQSRIVLRLCGWNWLVENNEKLLKISQSILPRRLFNRLMRETFYGQFVGGVDVEDMRPKLVRMQEFGVRPILDYSVESDLEEDTVDEVPVHVPKDRQFQHDVISTKRGSHKAVARSYPYTGESSSDVNLGIFIQCAEAASELCETDPFAAIKVTALGKPNALLEGAQFLSIIGQIFQDYSAAFDDTLPTCLDLKYLPKDTLGTKPILAQKRMTRALFHQILTDYNAEIGSSVADELFNEMSPDELDRVKFHNFRQLCMPGPPGKPLYQIFTQLKRPDGSPLVSPLQEMNLAALNRVEGRLLKLMDRAVEVDSKVLIDAEQTYFQPMIDFFSNNMMYRYNQDKVFVFNTYQCYLKSTPSQLIYDADKAKVRGYKFGAKLVRGAYMEQERQRALDLSYEDPIYSNKALTNSCYHNMFEVILPQIEQKKCEVMIASHNEFTIQYCVERMRQSNISPRSGGIYFGQLLGMCDQVTFLLGAGGYCSYKYVPYGPIEAVLPYLSRRAYENKGMLQGSQKEIDLLRGEMKRRKWGLGS